MRLISIGRLRAGPELALFDRYNGRLRQPLGLRELPEGTGAEAKRRECAAILAALPPRSFVVALDLGGQALSTEAFVAALARWRETGRVVTFVIGGAEGLDRAVLDKADAVLSLGPMTWPHFLVRPLLAEQLYRAQATAMGHPYHKTGRP